MDTKDHERIMKWDLRYLRLLADPKIGVASWSKDPSTQVAAGLVNPFNRLTVVGFNGFPQGIDDAEHRLVDREWKHRVIIHAEQNVLDIAPEPYLMGYTLYSTYPICNGCAKTIISRRVSRVVMIVPEFSMTGVPVGDWRHDWDMCFNWFFEAHVQVMTYSPNVVFA